MESSKAAVFVQTTGLPSMGDAKKLQVRGPARTLSNGMLGCCETVSSVMEGMSNIGFQATNLGLATQLIQGKMLAGRQFRKTVLQTENEQVEKRLKYEVDNTSFPERQFTREKLPPLIFVGIVSSMLRTQDGGSKCGGAAKTTIIHDSLLFLVREALVDVVVVSGGGLENDLRNLYDALYAKSKQNGDVSSSGTSTEIGFRVFVDRLIAKLYQRQNELYQIAMAAYRNRLKTSSIVDVEDGRVCEWALGPSTFWDLVGEYLVDAVANEGKGGSIMQEVEAARILCENHSVLYWCHLQGIPLFSPSITDGEMGMWLREWEVVGKRGGREGAPHVKSRKWFYRDNQKQTACGETSAPTAEVVTMPSFVFDLTRDVGRLNKITAWAKNPTCMLIFGGGVVKHHVCNANLFRNGADYSIFVNSAQEYDGSDGGARPDEAVSWGKIKKTVEKNCAVKVYGEASLIVPMLVAHGFGGFVQEGIQSLKLKK